MPRPVKPDRPVIAEPVVEPTQGTSIVVLHPGSSTLQLGRVSDHYPHSIPHVIAHRTKENCQVVIKEDNPLVRDGIWHPESEEKRSRGYHAGNHCLQSMRISGGYRKSKVQMAEVSQYNSKVFPIPTDSEAGTTWTDISNNPQMLIGEHALNLPPNAPYICKWPIRHGQLNIHSGPGGSATSVAADLEYLWKFAIEEYLGISPASFNFIRVVLIVPDMFMSANVKLMVNVLLNQLRFSCVIVHQESVCACLGAGIPSACVVDVGDQKTSVSCVEDGLSLPGSRITVNYGGSDISRCFLWLLQKSSFPYQSLDIHDKLDMQLLQELKETFCHLSFDIPAGHIHEFQVIRPHQKILTYKLKLGDEPMLAPVSLFVPDLLGICEQKMLTFFPEQTEFSSDDMMDDRYLLENKEKEGKKGKTDTDNTGDGLDLYSVSSYVSKKPKVVPNVKSAMSIDQAIMYSIEQCGNTETKRKMYGTILLVGGGYCFKGAEDFLLRKVQAQLPAHYQFVREQMEVVVRPKDVEPATVCWKGGTVLSILDSAQELWISQKEWNQYGVRILRERCAFQWSSNTDKL